MKILLVSNLFPPDVLGGYEILCTQVGQLLKGRGHDVLVLTGRRLPVISSFLMESVEASRP